MAQHQRWIARTVDELLDVVAAWRGAIADGQLSREEVLRIERELAEAVRCAEIADVTDLAFDEIRRTGGLTPYIRRRAERLGLRIATLIEPTSEENHAR